MDSQRFFTDDDYMNLPQKNPKDAVEGEYYHCKRCGMKMQEGVMKHCKKGWWCVCKCRGCLKGAGKVLTISKATH